MLLYSIALLVSIVFWLWIIRKYDRFEREPILKILIVFLAGGLISVIPAGILNQLFLNMIMPGIDAWADRYENIPDALVFLGFVGLNEEFMKAAATILLIRKSKHFNEPSDALVYSMTVAFGFAAFENIEYTMNYGYLTFFIRQFNAIPLHIGVASVWGMGIANAKFTRNGSYVWSTLPYLLIAALIHAVYNSVSLFLSPVANLLVASAIALLLIRFALRKVEHFAWDGPFANRLICDNCKTENFPDLRSCKKCGETFEMDFYTLCPDCNARISKAANDCPKCGAKINQA
jgi:RsiW-degrading membrane proteinase PrsW (M82 family)/ribosomal protein L40E